MQQLSICGGPSVVVVVARYGRVQRGLDILLAKISAGSSCDVQSRSHLGTASKPY